MKLIILFAFIGIYSFNIDCNKKFEITKATSQEWKGGRKETGYGTYYEITILPKVNSEILKFDKLWIGEKYFEVSCYQKGKRVKNDTFGAGDTVTIQVNHSTLPGNVRDNIKDNEPLPKEKYKGEALISYVYKGKRKYETIDKFTSIKPVYYP